MSACPYCKFELTPPAGPGDSDYIFACSACRNALGVRTASAELFTLPGETDVRTIATTGSFGGVILERLSDTSTELPVLPEMSRRVTKAIGNADTSMADLAAIIREDTAIAANVLRVANSAAYGGLHTVTELTAACSRLGQKTVANIVQSVASKSCFSSDDPVVGGAMERLWRHSVAVAHFASGLAKTLSMPNMDMVYLHGLFHDIGKLAILSVSRGADTKSASNGHLTDDVLLEVVDAYHRIAGLHMLIHWNLPPEFLVTEYYHDSPDRTPGDGLRRVVHVVALANKLAYVSDLGFGAEPDDETLMDHPSTMFLQLSDIKLANIRVDLEEKLDALLGAIAE